VRLLNTRCSINRRQLSTGVGLFRQRTLVHSNGLTIQNFVLRAKFAQRPQPPFAAVASLFETRITGLTSTPNRC